MANNTLKTNYEIALSIENGDKVKSTINAMDKSLRGLSSSAKALDFDAAEKSAKDLANQIHAMATSGEDATEQMEAFGRASTKAYKDLDQAAVKLNYSLSEQGKQQRERIRELESERASLAKTVEGKARAKQIDAELKALRKDVVVATDAELKAMLKANTTARARLKIAQQEAKNYKLQNKEQKELSKQIKGDLKPLQDKVKAMKDFAASLKTVEGRYAAIRTAAKGALAVGKGLAKAGGVVFGGAMALASSGAQAASQQVDRAREATRIRVAGMSQDDKENLLSEIYIDTGADTTTIVDAINRVVSILGPRASRGEISRAVEAEIRYPGAAAMFMQDTENPIKSSDFAIYQNRMKAIQGVTGATQEQVLASTQKIANLNQGAFSKASMTELQAVYLGLQGSGAFDSQEELDRAFDAFVKSQSRGDKSVFDAFYAFDWKKYADSNTNAYQIENAMRSMQWGALDAAAHSKSTDQQYTSAEETASRMRKMEETKNKLLIKIMEAVEPVIDKIDPQKIAKIFEKLTDILAFIADRLGKAVEADGFFEGVDRFVGVEDDSWFSAASAKRRREAVANFFGFANGGVASVPSIFGEAGPEMAIPLDPARAGRAQQLVGYVNNTFNMGGNETTAMSLANALNSREFVFQSGRMDRLNRRMGR